MSEIQGTIDALIKGELELGLKYEFWPALDSQSKKILIVLHGRGDSPEGFHFFPGALDIEELHTLFLRAPDPYGSGYSWYDLPPAQGPGVIRSRRLLMNCLDRLCEGGFLARNIFLCGFSQGCLMTLDVGLRYPQVLGALIGMSGYLFFEEEYPDAFSAVAKKQRFWISHGLQDEMLPFAKTEASINHLRSLGITIDWSPLDKAHNVDEVEEIALIQGFLTTQLESN